MISINEYLISKSNAKNLKNPEEVFDNESLNILYQKCIETYGTVPKAQLTNVLRTYDAYIKTHTELGDLVNCLAEVAEKHITGEGSTNYVYVNVRDAKRHPLKKDHYIITLRFNQNYFIETTIWEDRSVVGFIWWDDNRRRDVYYRGLKDLGFEYSQYGTKEWNSGKCLITKI